MNKIKKRNFDSLLDNDVLSSQQKREFRSLIDYKIMTDNTQLYVLFKTKDEEIMDCINYRRNSVKQEKHHIYKTVMFYIIQSIIKDKTPDIQEKWGVDYKKSHLFHSQILFQKLIGLKEIGLVPNTKSEPRLWI